VQSIEARARLTCVLIAGLALASLALSGMAARNLLVANAEVTHATGTMADQQRLDAELRRLRTGIGDATRRVERGDPVPASEWRRLDGELRRLLHLAPRVAAGDDLTDGAGTRLVRASSRFAAVVLPMLAAARADGSHEARMGDFLAALRELEAANMVASERLAASAEASAARSAELTRRWIAIIAVAAAVTLAVVVAFSLWLQRRVAAPLRRIAGTLEALAGSDSAGPLPEADRTDEIGALARGVMRYRRTAAERRDALRRLDHLARHDTLTGLQNRRSIDEALAESLATAAAEESAVALIYVDLDRFKFVNDSLGHAAGDAVLRDVGHLLREACADGEVVGRMGGDEFAIVQTGLAQPAAAKALSERILALAERRAGERAAAGEAAVGLSLGVALFPRDADDEMSLRHLADIALYSAKREGRSGVRFAGAYAPTTDTGSSETRRGPLTLELPRAIEAGELRLHYQPKQRLSTGRLDGVEALVRWQHPAHGLILPDRFVPLAEKFGHIRALTEWTLERAVADQARLADLGHEVAVHVNMSARLLGDAGFARAALATLERRRGVVGLEITETGILGDAVDVLAHLHAFVEAGLRLAIDDYGTGMWSLGHLRQLPAHELKVDRSFVADIARSHRDPLLVRSAIDLAHALGMEATAEGVESPAALALLRAMGCDLAQGYLISKPLSLGALTDFVREDARRGEVTPLAV